MQALRTEWDWQQATQLAAYYRWQQRGCPFGTPETDWFQAEEQLRQQAQKISNKPALLVVAGIIGSALGSFVMHWAFLRRLLGARPFLHFDKLAHPAPR
jgi:hypothetical protein